MRENERFTQSSVAAGMKERSFRKGNHAHVQSVFEERHTKEHRHPDRKFTELSDSLPPDERTHLAVVHVPPIPTMRELRTHLKHREVEGMPQLQYLPQTRKVLVPAQVEGISPVAHNLLKFIRRPGIQDRFGPDHDARVSDRLFQETLWGTTRRGTSRFREAQQTIYETNSYAAIAMSLQLLARQTAKEGDTQTSQELYTRSVEIRTLSELMDSVRGGGLTDPEYYFVKARGTDNVIDTAVDASWSMAKSVLRKQAHEQAVMEARQNEIKDEELIRLRELAIMKDSLVGKQLNVVNHEHWYRKVLKGGSVQLDTLKKKIEPFFERVADVIPTFSLDSHGK